MHIGLSQRVEFLADRRELRDCLDQAWAEMLGQAGLLAVPLPNQPGRARQWVDGLRLQGVILTGGNDIADVCEATNAAPERDAFERELIEICVARRLPLLGVCRGMQMIVHYLGGKIVKVKGHVGKPHPVAAQDTVIAGLVRSEVNSFHSFGTRPELLPEDLVAALCAPDGTVEAVGHRTLPIRAIMWHPERPVRAGMSRNRADLDLIRSWFGETSP